MPRDALQSVGNLTSCVVWCVRMECSDYPVLHISALTLTASSNNCQACIEPSTLALHLLACRCFPLRQHSALRTLPLRAIATLAHTAHTSTTG